MAIATPPGERAAARLRAGQTALVLAMLTVGETTVEGLPDVPALHTLAAACRGFGAIVRIAAGTARINGVGIGGAIRPSAVIDCSDDAHGAALLAGVAAGHRCGAALRAEAGLAERLAPALAACGAFVSVTADGGAAALAVQGAVSPLPVEFAEALPAPVAVAALVAGLNAPGQTRVRSACELPGDVAGLLRLFGARVEDAGQATGTRIVLTGRPELRPVRLDLAGSREAS